MLAELKIENVAVIEKAEVQFTPGLNVLTGETGAGKSIMIDSINAILGNRTSRDLVRSGAPKARIWATFESIPAHVREQVEKCGYGAQDDLLLYREISADGKGSCRINGMPATAGVVRDISAGLLTIHGQHDSTSLTNPATHLALLDQYAQDGAEYAAYHALYRALVTAKRALDALTSSEEEKQRRIAELSEEWQIRESHGSDDKAGHAALEVGRCADRRRGRTFDGAPQGHHARTGHSGWSDGGAPGAFR